MLSVKLISQVCLLDTDFEACWSCILMPSATTIRLLAACAAALDMIACVTTGLHKALPPSVKIEQGWSTKQEALRHYNYAIAK